MEKGEGDGLRKPDLRNAQWIHFEFLFLNTYY